MPPARVSVIVTTHDDGHVLEACLNSVERQQVTGGLETIVFDNASGPATRAILEHHADRVRLILHDRNLLYGGGNNAAAHEARGSVLVFLNADVELLGTDALERLARAAELPGVAIAGPRLLNPDGSLQPSCSAHLGLGSALLVGSGAHRLVPDRLRARLSPQHWSHDRAVDTGWVMGAAFAIRADVFRAVGGFWDRLYGEEADLAWRVQRRDLRVRFEPAVRVVHIGNQSAGLRQTDTMRAQRIAGAEVAFLRTHAGLARRLAVLLVLTVATAARAPVHAALGNREAAAIFRAMARVYARALL